MDLSIVQNVVPRTLALLTALGATFETMEPHSTMGWLSRARKHCCAGKGKIVLLLHAQLQWRDTSLVFAVV